MSKTLSRLFCFDFDNTIVDGHFHNALYDMGVASNKASPEQITSLLNTHAILNQDLLLKTFQAILSNGHHLAITTWSEYPEVIVPTLQKIGLNQDEIAQVHIESGIPSSNAQRKSPHIAKAKQHFGITDNQHVFLIDDDEDNIRQAQNEGQNGLHVSSPKTNQDYLQNILNLIEKPAPRRSVRIASLNTQEGQRLFEVHKDLQEKGNRRQGIRQDGEQPLARFFAKNPEMAPTTPSANNPAASSAGKPMISNDNNRTKNLEILRAELDQVNYMHKKSILAALFVSLSVAAVLWFSSISLLMLVSASSGAFSAVLFMGQMQFQQLIKAAKERTLDDKKWITENKTAFELGCQSGKSWMPYLKSYIHPRGYTSAYQLGQHVAGLAKRVCEMKATEVKPKP